jgi:calcineurin-like phosphoesterase family protein
MNRAWTADMHLGHSNVIEYCGRPFKDCNHMNRWMVDQANMRVTRGNRCVHVGDFCMKGIAKCREWVAQLHGDWTFIKGNHDKNNGVKPIAKWMIVEIGNYQAFVSHVPYFYNDPEDRTVKYQLGPQLMDWVENNCHFNICGHVHEKWKIRKDGKIPAINVGVDQWDYRPVFDMELLEYYEKEGR